MGFTMKLHPHHEKGKKGQTIDFTWTDSLIHNIPQVSRMKKHHHSNGISFTKTALTYRFTDVSVTTY